MTIGKLNEITTEMVKNGRSRISVCIDKSTFSHPLEEDGAVIMDVGSAEIQTIPLMDGDGFTEFRKDGSEKLKTKFVLSGK